MKLPSLKTAPGWGEVEKLMPSYTKLCPPSHPRLPDQPNPTLQLFVPPPRDLPPRQP